MKSKKMNSAALSQTDDALIIINPNGTITKWNDKAKKIFGYPAKESVGENISFIISKLVLNNQRDFFRNLKKGSKEQFEAVCINKKGKKLFILFSTFPSKDKKEKVSEILLIGKDISDQKLADEKKATLASIVNSSDDAIISKTLEGIITSWNRSATKMFGYTEKEAIGKHISIIIPKDRMDEETVIISNIRNGKRIDHFETIRASKDGTERHISLTVSPLKDSKGKIIGASKIARDISIRIEAEIQKQLFTERLQELNNYKDEFMVMASHELKTPLTVILANLQIAEMMMTGDPRKDFLDKAVNQAYKLSGLITNLLDVSKIQSGKLILNPTLFDLNILIEEISSNLQQTTTNHTIIFHNPNRKLMANADRERIEQVLINIIGNAIKYTPQKSEITIRAKKTGKNIKVEIYDKGIGIPDKDIRNIFLRFYRVSGSASSFSGSGIGLYISSEIIKRHGGQIWAESKIGKGSVFHFSIPSAK